MNLILSHSELPLSQLATAMLERETPKEKRHYYAAGLVSN